MIDSWQSRQGETLLPVQRMAVRKGLLDFATAHENMVIAAPTSSGKSFCAELAAVKALTQRRKAVLLYPLKSLLEQNYQIFRDTLSPLGVRCLVSSADHPENDEDFRRGRFELALSIYEKFDQLLTANLDILSNIGLIVIDELQMLGEPGRGATLERLLTKVLASSYRPRIIGLSAVLDEESSGRLADWLSAVLVREHHRPVDLFRGVAASGTVKLRSFNSTVDEEEPFTIPDDSEDGDTTALLLSRLKCDKKPTIVFLKSRQDTVRLAFRLAASVQWPEASRALEQLSGEEPSFLTRSLSQVLKRGVAFHNSDLSPEQRCIVEQAFVNGEVKVLCSTTTLALGVNLPADVVYLETVKFGSAVYDARPVLLPVTRAEFDNMTGRAGRLGTTGKQPGRAIVLAGSEFERDVLWNMYIAPDQPDTLTSAFASLPLDDWLLHLTAAGLIRDKNSACAAIDKSFASTEGKGPSQEAIEASLSRLSDGGFVRLESDGAVHSTALTQSVTQVGLSVQQALHFLNRLEVRYPNSPRGWLALAISAPDLELPPGFITRYERESSTPLRAVYERYGEFPDELSCLMLDGAGSAQIEFRRLALLKALLLLEDWSGMTEVRKLEENYQIHLGQVMALGEAASHLVAGLAGLLESQGRGNPDIESLRDLSFSVRQGLVVGLRDLFRRLGSVLSRRDYTRLHQAGVSSLSNLVNLSDGQLEDMVSDKHKLLKLNELRQSHNEEVDMRSIQDVPYAVMAAEPDSIEIEGTYDRERYLVKINGVPVMLTGKSFKYFTKLAWSRLRGEGGWIYKEDIEVGFNQARYLYRMKNEITSGLATDWPIVENNRLGYYRLKVAPQKIQINQDRLKAHPDWEVRQLFDESSTVN
jgi:helicase